MRIAIIGGGQSAAEAFIDLNDSFPSVQVDMILRGSALKPADDSPFVNEVFSPAFTDLVFQQEGAERERLVAEYQNTNYSVVDLDLIERIYGIFYRQKVSGIARQAFRTMTVVEKATPGPLGIELVLRNNANGDTSVNHYDAVILATGYERQTHRALLAPLAGVLPMALGLSMPAPAETFLKLLGGAAAPCALIALGLFLGERRTPVPGAGRSAVVLGSLKLLVHPLLVWLLATQVFALPTALAHAAVLMAVLPTGTGPFMLAEFHRREASTTAATVLGTTLLSLLTVTGYLALLQL